MGYEQAIDKAKDELMQADFGVISEIDLRKFSNKNWVSI